MPDGENDAESTEAPAEFPRVLKVLAAVIAPTTLITALLFYFGVNHAYWYFQYFGVNYTVMDLTFPDFLLRSVDPLLFPLTAALVVGLFGLWCCRLLLEVLSERHREILARVFRIAALVLGVTAIVAAIIGWIDASLFEYYLAIPGLCLACGVVLLSAVSRDRLAHRSSSDRAIIPGWVGLVEIGTVFILVSAGLFWSVTNYSAVVGSERARNTELGLPGQPAVFLYSEASLNIPEVSAAETRCSQDNAAYQFRYEGLRLVLASSTQFFFLPSDWPASGGVALVVPREPSLRLEFVGTGLEQDASC